MSNDKFVRNVSYSFIANLISFSISAILILIAPKFLGPEEYGMWQLFLFYISFAGCCHFGWIDGIYLRYAGLSVNELNPSKMSGQYVGLIFLETFVGILIYVLSTIVLQNPIRKLILQLSAIFPLLYNLNLFCSFILQITNQIKPYAKLILIERFTFFLGILTVVILGFKYFYSFYVIKVLSLIVACIAGFHICRNIFTYPFESLSGIIEEAKENIRVGIKLLIANTSSVLVIGIIRYGISEGWDIVTFGRVSLTLTISNFLMIFINAVSVVLFPALRRISSERLPELYLKIRDILSAILFTMLIFYYPIRLIFSVWLPQYAAFLKYMIILFPVCVFESKVVLLINTYLKDLREEAAMLKINLNALLLSSVWTVLSVFIVHNLAMAVFGILIACGFRCFISEICIQKILQIQLYSRIFDDLLLVGCFILSGYIFDGFISTGIYTLVLCFVVYRNYSSILSSIHFLRGKKR